MAYVSVTVSVDGQEILTLEPNMLSGADMDDANIAAVKEAAAHLASFAGGKASFPDWGRCPVCLGINGCKVDCPF